MAVTVLSLLPSSIGSEEELTGTPLACLKASPLHSSSCTCIRSNRKLQFLTFSSFKSQRQLGCDGDGFLESSCSCVQCTSPARCPWTLAFSTTALQSRKTSTPSLPSLSRAGSHKSPRTDSSSDGKVFSRLTAMSPLFYHFPSAPITSPSNTCHKKKHIFLHTSFRGWRSHFLLQILNMYLKS